MYLKWVNTTRKHHWKVIEGQLERLFEFPSFSSALAFVIAVGRVSELSKHHPSITIDFTRVTLRSCTHDEGGNITEKDHQLARDIDSLYTPFY